MTSFFKPTVFKRMLFFILLDTIISLGTLYLSYALRFNFDIPPQFFVSFWLVFGLLTGLKIVSMYMFKNYFIVWRFFSFVDAKNIVKAHIVAYILFIIIFFLITQYISPLPRSVIIIDFFLSLIFMGTLRIFKRVLSERLPNAQEKPTLLLGASSKTGTIIQSALKGEINYYPVAIVALEDDNAIKNAYIHNLKVFALSNLKTLIKEKKIVSAVITEDISTSMLKTVVSILNEHGVHEIKKVKILGNSHEKLENLSISDLLARHPKDLDLETIENFIKGKKVLITGAGGSIGSEIALQCSKFGASSLMLIDHSEYNLYQIGEKLPKAKLTLLNISKQVQLEEVFAYTKPEIVIHAAAYKHVPICESNQEVAIENNIVGSKVLIDTCIKYNVQKVVIISTDKAVRPTNVMGATKRITELYASNVDAKNTEIVAVRFGNVLGSSGSVIPKFKMQIEDGGPVTVTHPNITRYFMLIPEACQLVLQTAAIAKGGELFILDMGEPIKIVDLAYQMIKLYGKKDEVEVVFTGLRPGEKLYEELLLDETEQKTKYDSIFIAKPTYYNIDVLNNDIQNLLMAKNKIEKLQKIVPEFTHTS